MTSETQSTEEPSRHTSLWWKNVSFWGPVIFGRTHPQGGLPLTFGNGNSSGSWDSGFVGFAFVSIYTQHHPRLVQEFSGWQRGCVFFWKGDPIRRSMENHLKVHLKIPGFHRQSKCLQTLRGWYIAVWNIFWGGGIVGTTMRLRGHKPQFRKRRSPWKPVTKWQYENMKIMKFVKLFFEVLDIVGDFWILWLNCYILCSFFVWMLGLFLAATDTVISIPTQRLA